jgi:putative effector of murein hydrolase LrgA (UPF0299 family)
MANQPVPSAEDANVSRRELRLLKWLTVLLVPGTIILIYELVRQEALEHLLPALPSQYGSLIVWGFVQAVRVGFARRQRHRHRCGQRCGRYDHLARR